MKLRLLTFILALCGTAATAQNPYIAPQGVIQSNGGITVSQPRTVLAVDLTAERDVTLCGPYARYAQKYLGVRAPLTDKTSYSIKGASIALFGDDSFLAAAPAATQKQLLSHSQAVDEFARIQPDKTSMVVPALEDAAREAANTIFSLRKHRLELISGEAGENVFGEGLKSALEEITRLEQEYLELFLGKRVVTTETRRFVINPKSDKKQYILCRFSSAAGLLPDNDLSGDIVLLQIEPSGNTKVDIEASSKESSVTLCRVADPSTCTVICGNSEYARAVLPIFELGRTVRVAIPRSR